METKNNEKKNMHDNFKMIIPRLIDSFNYLDIEKAHHILENIKHHCLCIGTGGSYSPSLFASMVLEAKNKIIATPKEPRDILFMNLFYNYGFLLGITYGNKNHGINQASIRASDSKYSTHLITNNSNYEEDICYKGSISPEYSFISLAGTVLPMSIVLSYYLKDKFFKDELINLIQDMYAKASEITSQFSFDEKLPLFEIMSDTTTCVASQILVSTITEAGLGIPIIHDKYSYCHGRSTLSYNKGNSNLIYLINENSTALDNELLTHISQYYKYITILSSKNHDYITNQFDLALQSLFLCKKIAEAQQKDLSIVEYSPVVKKLYYYKGEM